MHIFKRLAAMAALCLAVAVAGYEVPLGVVTSIDGGSFNNLTSKWPDAGANTFTLPFGIKTSVQCDLSACVRACSTGSSCVSTCAQGKATSGVKLPADALFDIPTDSNINAISIQPFVPNTDAGSVNCQVFQVLP